MRGWLLLGATFFTASVLAAPQGAPDSATSALAIPHEPPIQVFDSPDGALVVWATEGHGGVVISVQDKNEHELASEGHYPEDRPGGFRFKQGGWTPDSKFFVYSTSSWQDSGHNPMDMPVYVYSRAKNAFFDLRKSVGLFKPRKFNLGFPDTVDLEVIDSKMQPGILITLQLTRIIAKE